MEEDDFEYWLRVCPDTVEGVGAASDLTSCRYDSPSISDRPPSRSVRGTRRLALVLAALSDWSEGSRFTGDCDFEYADLPGDTSLRDCLPSSGSTLIPSPPERSDLLRTWRLCLFVGKLLLERNSLSPFV